MATIEQSQQGFEPTALRQAFVEFAEKWAKEYEYTKQPKAVGDCDNDISVNYAGNKKGLMSINDMGRIIHLDLPVQLLNSYVWGSISYSQPVNYGVKSPLFYFDAIEIKGGEYGLQTALKVKKQIERRIKQIEKKGAK